MYNLTPLKISKFLYQRWQKVRKSKQKKTWSIRLLIEYKNHNWISIIHHLPYRRHILKPVPIAYSQRCWMFPFQFLCLRYFFYFPRWVALTEIAPVSILFRRWPLTGLPDYNSSWRLKQSCKARIHFQSRVTETLSPSPG